MTRIGFSTGALALSDFQSGLSLTRDAGLSAVELSALRETEVAPLLQAIPQLALDSFDYISFHAPSRLQSMTECDLIDQLVAIRDRGWPIVLHPDVISDLSQWTVLGDSVLLENMDQRKPVARTAAEMRPFFTGLPQARFCFDIAHARQVDPTMSVAVELLMEFGDRLAEIHISEVDANCRHIGMSSAAVNAYQRIASLIPDDIPVIIESVIEAGEIAEEVEMAEAALSSRRTADAIA